MVILVTKDLFFVPSVRGAVESAGGTVQVVKSLVQGTFDEVLNSGTNVTTCLVDLTAVSLADLPVQKSLMEKNFPDAALVAFGPHVHQNRLDAALEAGFTMAISRGQLDRDLMKLAEHWCESAV